MAATQFSRPFTVWGCLDHRRPLGRRIETERRRLQKANAVLQALECALNEEEIAPIVAADAANVVRGLIDDAILLLDAVSLVRGEPTPPPATGEPTERGQQAAEGSEQSETDDESENDGIELEDDDDKD